jgi:WD40 repeat protein
VNLMAKRALRSGAGKEMALKRDRFRANKNAHNAGEGGKKSSGGGGTTVECLNYSPELNLIAFGGVQGKVGVLDATTVTFKGLYDAHNPHSAGKKGEG